MSTEAGEACQLEILRLDCETYELNPDLIGIGVRIGTYLQAVPLLLLVYRGAFGAARGVAESLLITQWALVVSLIAQGWTKITDKEFIGFTNLLFYQFCLASFAFSLEQIGVFIEAANQLKDTREALRDSMRGVQNDTAKSESETSPTLKCPSIFSCSHRFRSVPELAAGLAGPGDRRGSIWSSMLLRSRPATDSAPSQSPIQPTPVGNSAPVTQPGEEDVALSISLVDPSPRSVSSGPTRVGQAGESSGLRGRAGAAWRTSSPRAVAESASNLSPRSPIGSVFSELAGDLDASTLAVLGAVSRVNIVDYKRTRLLLRVYAVLEFISTVCWGVIACDFWLRAHKYMQCTCTSGVYFMFIPVKNVYSNIWYRLSSMVVGIFAMLYAAYDLYRRFIQTTDEAFDQVRNDLSRSPDPVKEAKTSAFWTIMWSWMFIGLASMITLESFIYRNWEELAGVSDISSITEFGQMVPVLLAVATLIQSWLYAV